MAAAGLALPQHALWWTLARGPLGVSRGPQPRQGAATQRPTTLHTWQGPHRGGGAVATDHEAGNRVFPLVQAEDARDWTGDGCQGSSISVTGRDPWVARSRERKATGSAAARRSSSRGARASEGAWPAR